MTEHTTQPLSDDTPASPPARLRALQERLLAGDPAARRELERIAELSSLESLVDDVERARTLREFQFTSSLPVVGRLVVAARSAINSLSAKWVARALIQQQNQFNRAVTRALEASLDLNRRLIERIETLEARVAELEREKRSG